MGTQLPPTKGAQQPPHFSAHVYMYIVTKRSPISATAELVPVWIRARNYS